MALLLAPDDTGIAQAAELLRAGALVAFPTDTVYGIGCRVGDEAALARLLEAKRRPAEKRVPILVASLGEAANLGFDAGRARSAADRFWPGGLTLVLGDTTRNQAFRAPDHPVALALIGAAGPLATSSANRSGEPETYEANDVLIAFADTDLLDAVIDGGRVPGGVASSVLDLSVDPPRLVREGAISRAELEGAIGTLD
ncbi:MAG: L-threonylcarbamoyladenylate synthase [Chloroflexota bacterium]|nr:L-threonylcarbamoyladenylate synthase [Chloroflexota bacterium]